MESQEAVDPVLLEKIAKKQQERRESFSKIKKDFVLDKKAQGIVALPVNELLCQLQARQLSAREVLCAYTAKALEVTGNVNCVTEFNPKALAYASVIDAEKNAGNPLPLHGLPFAVKDDLDVEGLDSTLGYAKRVDLPASAESALVKSLVKCGAIPFLKTNVPQSLFSATGENPIYGATTNALNDKLSPGGSSAGSGSIIAAGGAPIATGSDLGGSLRIPSHFHGVATIRPTINRLSGKGLVQCMEGTIAVTGVPGIIAPNAKILSLVWKAITENGLQNDFDPLAMPIPWNEALFSSKEKLNVGYFTSLPFFPPFEDTRKTVLDAVAALESEGHRVIPFEMVDEVKCLQVYFDLLMADQGAYLKGMFAGEPISNCVAGLVHGIRNAGIKNSAAEVNNGEERTERDKILTRCGDDVKTAGDLSKLANERKTIILDILERMEKAGVDVLLSPAFPHPAVKLGDAAAALHGAVYTCIWNLVDFPAGVVRFGTESGKNIDSYDDQGEPAFKLIKEGLSESAGMPICVQIIGRPFKEEIVLRTLVELENLYKSKN